MNIDFNKYNHGSGYVIKVLFPRNEKLKIETIVHGKAQVLPNIKAMTSDYFFDIASLTKFYTAIIVHKTIEKGLLKLEDAIKSIDDRFVDIGSLTVGDLLSHKQEIWTDGYLGIAKNKEEFCKMLFNSKIKNNNRTYVDAHYIILSFILEKVYNKPFAEIVNQEIIKPLGLKNTTFNCLTTDKVVSNNFEMIDGKVVDFITPGTVHDTKARTAKKLGISVGHAGIFTTATDLIKLLASLIDDEYVLLSKEAISRMLDHDDATIDIYSGMKKYAKDKNISISDNYIDINEIYDDLAKKVDKNELLSKIIRPYNYCGTRYKNPINAKNEIPETATANSIIFSGYTGPIFFIDFERKIIILVMTNVCHNSSKSRSDRYDMSKNMINDIYNQLLPKN